MVKKCNGLMVVLISSDDLKSNWILGHHDFGRSCRQRIRVGNRVWNTLWVGKKLCQSRCDEVLDIGWKESMLWDDEVSMLEHMGCKVCSVGGRAV
jgi:hypothetical protein